MPQARASRSKQYWLVKTEPDVYSIDDLKRDRVTGWDGVRNYQARNFMRDDMKRGDQVLIYHSNATPPGVVGVGEIAKESYPDPTAFDPNDPHFDPKSDPAKPRWMQVDIRFRKKFKRLIPLQELRDVPALSKMPLLQRGQRLSVQPVDKKDFERIVKLSDKKPPSHS